jgi:2-(1,2-epoxy-1,2-dihydrophenyl)acetyl-CoA isomerase
MTDKVILDIDDGVATILLNDPDRMNALSKEVHHGLIDAFDWIECNEDIRCVVFEGAGRAFSAGGDIDGMRKVLNSEVERKPSDWVTRVRERANVRARRLHSLSIPSVAKLDGLVLGAGANLALGCDVQYASEETKFGFVFRNVGLTLDAGISYLLPRLVGTNTAKELALTGDIIDSEYAQQIGLVDRVYSADEFQEATEERIRTIAEGPTIALEYTVDLIDRGFDSTLDEALENEATAQGIVGATEDHKEGVQAFFEDREPEFEGK